MGGVGVLGAGGRPFFLPALFPEAAPAAVAGACALPLLFVLLHRRARPGAGCLRGATFQRAQRLSCFPAAVLPVAAPAAAGVLVAVKSCPVAVKGALLAPPGEVRAPFSGYGRSVSR